MPTTARRRSTPTKTAADASAESGVTHRNEVLVVGRLAAAAESRELPSGDVVVSFRVVVEREGPPVAGRPHLDTLDCAVWTGRQQRTVASWQAGDIVEVSGALRRRFWRSGPALNSRYEIETTRVRRIMRAAEVTAVS